MSIRLSVDVVFDWNNEVEDGTTRTCVSYKGNILNNEDEEVKLKDFDLSPVLIVLFTEPTQTDKDGTIFAPIVILKVNERIV